MTSPSLSSCSFSMEQLLCAMAPTEHVLDAFVQEQNDNAWYTEESQQRFARILQSHWMDNETNKNNDNDSRRYGPSSRYLVRLVKRYVSRIETTSNNHNVENDELMELIMKCSMMKDVNILNANECCHVSFSVPSSLSTTTTTTTSFDNNNNNHDTNPQEEEIHPQPSHQTQKIYIQVYPQHNDVGVRKVWEAGACLSEFFIRYPHFVRHKRIVELGAGVGLTGLVIAQCCTPTHVHMTDYTIPCLQNLQHNIDINNNDTPSWLTEEHQEEANDDNPSLKASSSSSKTIVTCGYLEWDSYADDDDDDIGASDSTHIVTNEQQQAILTQAESAMELSKADVIIAGDVAYDVTVLPSLGKLVRRFLYSYSSEGRQKFAIFATTLRNKDTFTALENALLENGIRCTYIDPKDVNALPEIFPCYLLVQPRSDIRICVMTAATATAPPTMTTIEERELAKKSTNL